MLLQDALIIDGSEDASQEDYFLALQRSINSGMGWHMQGSTGRAMMNAIRIGRCMLGTSPCRDAWGNRIPSRTEVMDGTKGSRSFVVDNCGEDWAVKLEALDA